MAFDHLGDIFVHSFVLSVRKQGFDLLDHFFGFRFGLFFGRFFFGGLSFRLSVGILRCCPGGRAIGSRRLAGLARETIDGARRQNEDQDRQQYGSF